MGKKSDNPSLLDPVKLGDLQLKNRVALAPESDPATWHSGTHGAEGYTDYPNHAPRSAEANR